MFRNNRWALMISLCGLLMTAGWSLAADRAAAEKAIRAGKLDVAFETNRQLALDPAANPQEVPDDFIRAVICLVSANRADEVDAIRDEVVAAQPKNWRLLQIAAQTLLDGDNYGYLIAGKFRRGPLHGRDGKPVGSAERDRAQALQLMSRALPLVAAEADNAAAGEFYMKLAGVLMGMQADREQQIDEFNRGMRHDPSRQNTLTDLSKLPDYEQADEFIERPAQHSGAPAGLDGSPVFPALPKSWAEAQTDGQRWRWCLQKASELSPGLAARATFVFADFLRGQFDVQTLKREPEEGARFDLLSESDLDQIPVGAPAVRDLPDDQTLARLSVGVRHVKLPDEYNFIRLFRHIADGQSKPWAEHALTALAHIYGGRQQYERAAACWKESLDRFGDDQQHAKREELHQIMDNWVQIGFLPRLPAGTQLSVPFYFRNGRHVHFEAQELDIHKMLDDLKAEAKRGPQLHMMVPLHLEGLNSRFFKNGSMQYVGAKIAEWEMDIPPKLAHLDAEAKAIVPFKKAGAYLLTAKINEGNSSKAVLWVIDTVIAEKPADGGVFLFVADAASGKPLPGAKVESFGFSSRPRPPWEHGDPLFEGRGTTDAHGLAKLLLPADHTWVITASTDDGHFGYYCPRQLDPGTRRDDSQDGTIGFLITDRPAYEPGQAVNFKVLLGEANYDRRAVSSRLVNQSFKLSIRSPFDNGAAESKELFKGDFRTDALGQLNGQFNLPNDAALGDYSVIIGDDVYTGTFKVVGYRKPQFGLRVDAPREPILFGQKISAMIGVTDAKGIPVRRARVKYKVSRSRNNSRWYPPGRWDWLFSPGYEQLGPDYTWWPGWSDWAVPRPAPFESITHSRELEIVANAEGNTAEDGKVKLEIQTAQAGGKPDRDDPEDFFNTDQITGDKGTCTYEITAELAVSAGEPMTASARVIVAARPFKVYTSVDRGFYRAGDTVEADFFARTPDGKPVRGNGNLKLLWVSFREGKPIESVAQKWDLNTDERGSAHQRLKIATPGEYRLSYSVSDGRGNAIEGAQVFLVRSEDFDFRQLRFNPVELIPEKREYQPGAKARVMINTRLPDATVILLLRPLNGIAEPMIVHVQGCSTIQEIAVNESDMPNFCVEADTIYNGRVFSESRDIVVSPINRVLNVEARPERLQAKPGEHVKLKFRLSDDSGRPTAGSITVALFAKTIDSVAGQTDEPDIKKTFWGWRRSHYPDNQFNPTEFLPPMWQLTEPMMSWRGSSGRSLLQEAVRSTVDLSIHLTSDEKAIVNPNGPFGNQEQGGLRSPKNPFGGGLRAVQVRRPPPTTTVHLSDAGVWLPSIAVGPDGIGAAELTVPQTSGVWTVRAWAISAGVRVGETSAEIVTTSAPESDK